MEKKKATATNNTTNLAFEAKLWQAADALRNNMDAAEYKHVVLGLIFLKYISYAFEEQDARLEAKKAQAKQPTIGLLVNDSIVGIERNNPAQRVLLKNYARLALDKT